MEKQKSFEKAIKYLNDEIADYENQIKYRQTKIDFEQWFISSYKNAIRDYEKIRDELDINTWDGYLGTYGWIRINKRFSDD